MAISEYEIVNCLLSNDNHSLCVVKTKGGNEKFLMKSCQFDDSSHELVKRYRHKREIEFISSFDHPNIIKPLTSESKSASLSIIYPFRKGTTLQRYFSARINLNIAEKLKMIIQLTEALEHIHSRGIVHGDLHPGNIFVGENRGVEIYDFSMCMTLEEVSRRQDGVVIGTYPYLSPEQTGFTRFKVDTRSDLYCAGIILYQLLSNHFPYEVKSNTIEELLDFMLKTELEPIRTIPYYINEILLKALRSTPEERYQTASGFKYDLRMALDIIQNDNSIQTFVPGEKDTIIAVTSLRYFIAREKEIEILIKGLNALKHKESSSYLLSGVSGIGKSEIIRNFLASEKINEIYVISVKCNRFTPNQPYSAIRSLLLDFLTKVQDKDTKDKAVFRKHLNNVYAEYSGFICDVIPEMKGYFDSVEHIEFFDKQRETEKFSYTIVSILDLICASFSVVIVVDDLQWIDYKSFDLLIRLKHSEAAKMMIFAYRTENLTDKRFFNLALHEIAEKQIEVRKFSRNEVVWLVYSIFDQIQNDEILIDVLENKCYGNPFILNQMLGYLLDASIIKKVNGSWTFTSEMVSEIPGNFDSISLVNHKIASLSGKELKYLKIGSLMGGTVQLQILEEIAGFDASQSKPILKRLESEGFIVINFKGEVRFAHDKIQDIIISKIPDKEKAFIYEALAVEYEALSDIKMEYLFDAAEIYRKTSQTDKAIELAVKAGNYALEKAAYELAVTDFSSALEMIEKASLQKKKHGFDVRKIELSLAEALMLNGKNEQALHFYNKHINDNKEMIENCDILYRVGCIYFNIGQHLQAQNSFRKATSIIGINLCVEKKNKLWITFIQIILHMILSSPVSIILPKKDNEKNRLSVKILSKYVQSLFVTDINNCLYPHFLALNLSRSMDVCIEKLEIYLLHTIISYFIFFKRSSFKYLNKVISIVNQSGKKSLVANTKAVSGALHYYAAKWKFGEKDFLESISECKTSGDCFNQVTCLDYLSRIDYFRGDLKRALEHINHAVSLSDGCNNKRIDLRPVLASKLLIEYISDIKDDITKEHNSIFASDNDTPFLVQTRLKILHLEYELLKGNIFEAWQICLHLNSSLSGFYLNTEYAVSLFLLTCDLVAHELIKDKIEVCVIKDRKKLIDIFNHSLKMLLWFSFKFPAYRGAAYRFIGWYLYLIHNNKKIAGFFINKSVHFYHRMHMKIEEARSLRDYGLLNEQCNSPGFASDLYNAAFKIFKQCGAQLEVHRIIDKISSENRKIFREEIIKSSLCSAENSNQIRFDTLLQISSSISEITDVSLLLNQVLSGMIKATGAQYGCVYVKGQHNNLKCMLKLDFQGNQLDDNEMVISQEIVKNVEESRHIILVNDGIVKSNNNERIRSVLCVPFCREDDLLGYFYLGNDKVAGLFSESAVKTAQILSAHAGILLENAYLMEKYKQLNRELDNKVKLQTHDITEKNRQLEIANLKLVESERVKGVLSGTLVHDIKNYAAGIEGNLQYLGRKLEPDPKVNRVLNVVSETCSDIVSLASNLLDIAKMDEGKLVVRAENLDSTFIVSIAEKFKNNTLFEEKGIQPVIFKAEKKFSIFADVYLLERVLQNMFSNAAKYVPREGIVEMSFLPGEDENTLCFYNHGVAIPEKEREILFEKYARIENQHSQYSKGLGLFFCRMVMNAHKGRIWVESDEKGNHFKLAFPNKHPVSEIKL